MRSLVFTTSKWNQIDKISPKIASQGPIADTFDDKDYQDKAIHRKFINYV